MIVLIFPTFRSSGNLVLDETEGTSLGAVSRRVQRRATIDGGAHFDDQGFSHVDRTMLINVQKTVWLKPRLEAFVAVYGIFGLSCREGFFTGTIDRISEDDTTVTIQFLVQTKEA